MVRFSLKRLLASVALVSIGLAIDAPAYSHPMEIDRLTQFCICAIAGAFIGAGILNPFGRSFVGAALGALIALPFSPLSMMPTMIK